MFSVIIPLYNKGELIKRAIDSVLSQTFQDFEIIIVDDGSVDDSALYVKEYVDKRIKYFYKQNGGVSSARNYGIDKATFDWLLFLDADDELLPKALETFRILINKYSKCKFFVGGFIWSANNDSTQTTVGQINPSHFESILTKRPFFSLWLRNFYPSPRNMVSHKTLFDVYGRFDLRMSFYEDYELVLRLLQCGQVAYTQEPVATYHQNNDGLSKSLHSLEKEMAYHIPEIIDKVDFWYKALLYENIEQEMSYWKFQNSSYTKFYGEMRNKYFSCLFRVLHWVRQKMIRIGFI